MNFAEGMNILATNTNLEKKKERLQRAQALYEDFKPSIKHFARLGYYQTTFTMPPSETRKEDIEELCFALKTIFLNEGFDVHSFNTRHYSFIVSWKKATTNETVV